MLCRRPMLSLALAAALGVVAARHLAWTTEVLPYGWLAVIGLSVWFILTPRPLPPPPAAIPENYAPLILPAPGPLARRGLTRFVLILSLACALAAASRQSGWAEGVSPALLPEQTFFDATFAALAPQRDFPGQTGAWRVPARLLTVNGAACPPVDVSLTGGAGGAFRRGDIILGRVRRGTVRPPPFPGAFDFAFWLERDGLAGTAYLVRPRSDSRSDRPPAYSRAPNYSVVPVDDTSVWLRLRRGIDSVRGRAVAATLAGGGEFGGLLAAMLFGYREDIGDEVRDAFRRIGIGHVLAISGLHVGLIVGLLWWLAGLAGMALRPRALACLVLVIVYLGLAGGQTAAARATCMAGIHLASLACGRRSDMMNSLGAAAFLLVFLNPTAPLDISFQLSFTAVVFIYMALGGRPDPALPGTRPSSRPSFSISGALLRQIASLARLSFTTWAGLFPIIAAVFNQVNLIGLVVNIPAIPLMSLVLAGGLLLPWLAWIPGAAEALTAPTRVLVWLAGRADAVPYSSFAVHAPGGEWLAAFYFFIFALLLRGMLRPSPLRRLWSRGVAVGLAAATIGLLVSMRSAPPPEAGRVTRLTGGRGLIAVQTPQGRAALLGTFSRGGILGAEWLHHVRHGGGVAVVALGGRTSPAGLAVLDWHFPLTDFTRCPVTDSSAAGPAVWREIPGVPEARYAVGRDGRGRAVWIGARIGREMVFVGVR